MYWRWWKKVAGGSFLLKRHGDVSPKLKSGAVSNFDSRSHKVGRGLHRLMGAHQFNRRVCSEVFKVLPALPDCPAQRHSHKFHAFGIFAH
jgi:hypothetical protein